MRGGGQRWAFGAHLVRIWCELPADVCEGVSVVSVTGVSLGLNQSLSESICPTGSTLARQMTGNNPPVSRTFSMLVRQMSDKRVVTGVSDRGVTGVSGCHSD